MVIKQERQYKMYIGLIMLILILITFFLYYKKEGKITGEVVKGMPITQIVDDPSVLIYLSFDDVNNPWKDYSTYDHIFQVNGQVNLADKSVCKWYGCADLSVTDGSDYLSSTTKFALDNGMAVSFWVYLNENLGSPSQAFYQIGENENLKWTQEASYGLSTSWNATNGAVGTTVGSTKKTSVNKWTHYFLQYDKNKYSIWKNGELINDVVQTYGNLNYNKGEIIYVGKGLYGIDTHGYIDEFLVYNRSNFTQAEVYNIYDEKRLGTPPDKDLYVKNIKYELPRDWGSKYNSLTPGKMDIVITIANEGITNAENFDYELNLDGNSICNGRIKIDSVSEKNITCTWSTSYGYHIGNVKLDTSNEISEDNKDNNIQKLYVPFLDHPYMQFDLTEWNNNLKSYCSNPSNIIAYDSCGFYKNFVSEDFNDNWNGNNVDPRGKKGRENAIGCLYNDYDMTKTQCQRAKNHLFGWANRNITSYTNVQSIHELSQVGMIYDIMFPVLTKEENELVSKELYDICQHVFNLDNVRPDLDNDNEINGGNGKGFGSGMAYFCYSIIGGYKENPTLIHENEQSYYGKNIPDEWIDREESYLKSYKNDPWAKYQERWLYKFYSQFHLVENWYFEKRYGLGNLDNYQNALCAMGREFVTDMLDHNYNGLTLRNDENRNFRGVQAGDGNSYEDPGSDSIISWSIVDYYGVLCDDINVKSSLLYLRDLSYNNGESTKSLNEIYIYKQLRDQASPQTPETSFPKVIFDNANDILTIRTNYTYKDDTVIQIDGGEEKGGGHSQAQGDYLYALGEPFLDYEQVPNEDDVRNENFKNGISFKDIVPQGSASYYSDTCGNAPLNQYYGMGDCNISGSYPDYRNFPLKYGGDVEDYLGTTDANFAGVMKWQPYKNSDPVSSYYVKFGDLLAKRVIVKNNIENKIYHNFINIYDEFSQTSNGNDITFTRNNKNLDIKVIYSTQTLTLGGGNSNYKYAFTKTGTPQGKGNYRRTYLYTPNSNLDLILSLNWYLTGNNKAITQINNLDQGLKQDNNVIIFDTSNNGITEYGTKKATGWALAYNDNTKEIGAFNTTRIENNGIILLTSDNPISAHIKRSNDVIMLTANTMERSNYIDISKEVKVTIDAQELTNDAGFFVKKNDVVMASSESGTQVTFTMSTDQNSDVYTITGNRVNNNYKTTTISLQQGWNLINIPFQLSSSNVKDVFLDIRNSLEVIQSFDPNQGWLVYHFDESKPSNSFQITPGKGYRIKAKQAVSLQLTGLTSQSARTLEKGWHLIGIKQTENILIKDFFQQNKDKITEILTLENGLYQEKDILSNENMPNYRGYWIYVNETISI